MVWILNPRDPQPEESQASIEQVTLILALFSEGAPSPVTIATDGMLEGTNYAKKVTAAFQNWQTIDGLRIRLTVKYFLEPSTESYFELKVSDLSDITLNSNLDVSQCSLTYYNLPEPGVTTSRPGSNVQWSLIFVVAGVL